MKNYWKEILAALLQAALFWLLPLCAGPTDIMGMVVLMMIGTFALGALLGVSSKSMLRFALPPFAALVFLPSIPVYYNFTALIHVVWYLVLSYAGVGLGALLRFLVDKITSNHRAGA